LVSLAVRCAFGAALALGLAGCGRKSGLDPPPGGLAEPSVIGSQHAPGPDGQVAASGAPTTAPSPPPPAKKTFPLDWLIN